MNYHPIHNQAYCITVKDHLRVGAYTLIYALIFIPIFLLFLSRHPQNFLVIGSVFLVVLLFVIPGVYLHINHYHKNKDYVLFEYTDKIVIIKPDKSTFEIHKQNILDIHIYMAPNMIRYDGTRLGHEKYNYVFFNTTDGKVYISNMLFPDIKALGRKFEEVIPIYHKTIFARIG